MMGGPVLRAFALLGSFAAASSPSGAGARELGYRAPSGCPSRDEVAARIEARAPAGRDARIEVIAEGSGFRGDVVLGAGERQLTRSVEAQTCAAVVEALALVVALDRDEDPRAPEEPTSAPPAAPPLAPTPDVPAVAPPSPIAETRRPLMILVGADASGTGFARGTAIYAVPVFAELDFVAPWLHALRGGFIYSFPTTTSNARVRPQFQVTAATLDLCPFAFVSRPRGNGMSPFVITACAHGEVGFLDAAGAGDPKSQHRRLWTNAGAVVRSRVGLGGTMPSPFVEVSGGLLAPLVRDHFHFEDNDPITAPPLLWTLALGVGLVVR
jgi:hypothetical protein